MSPRDRVFTIVGVTLLTTSFGLLWNGVFHGSWVLTGYDANAILGWAFGTHFGMSEAIRKMGRAE